MSVGHKVDVSRTASMFDVESVGESEESVGESVVSVRSASDTNMCLLCAAFPSVLLLCARGVFGVCNGLRRCFSFSDLLEAARCMHLHSSRMVACCVRGRPFPMRACVV